MKDDSLTDVAFPAARATDNELIDELKKRGFKVYPEKRVRIYRTQYSIGYVELGRMDEMHKRNELIDRTYQRLSMDIGVELFEAGVCVRSATDEPFGKTFAAQVAVILPNTFDFETEMWGIRR